MYPGCNDDASRIARLVDVERAPRRVHVPGLRLHLNPALPHSEAAQADPSRGGPIPVCPLPGKGRGGGGGGEIYSAANNDNAQILDRHILPAPEPAIFQMGDPPPSPPLLAAPRYRSRKAAIFVGREIPRPL